MTEVSDPGNVSALSSAVEGLIEEWKPTPSLWTPANRIRIALGMRLEATDEQVAVAVEDAAKDFRRLHKQYMALKYPAAGR